MLSVRPSISLWQHWKYRTNDIVTSGNDVWMTWITLTEWPSDSVTVWPSDRVTERLSDRVAEWPSDRVTEWLSDQVTECPSDQVTEWPWDQVTEWQEASQTIDRMVYFSSLSSGPHLRWLRIHEGLFRASVRLRGWAALRADPRLLPLHQAQGGLRVRDEGPRRGADCQAEIFLRDVMLN